MEIANGNHNLLMYISNPNHLQDGYINNDSLSFDFNYKSIPTLELKGDVTNVSCFGGQDGMASVFAKTKVEIKEDWETSTDWNIVNGSEVNHWVIGSATANGGNKSIYISKDNTNNTYNTYTSSIVHFYKDFYFPHGATNIISNSYGSSCTTIVSNFVASLFGKLSFSSHLHNGFNNWYR